MTTEAEAENLGLTLAKKVQELGKKAEEAQRLYDAASAAHKAWLQVYSKSGVGAVATNVDFTKHGAWRAVVVRLLEDTGRCLSMAQMFMAVKAMGAPYNAYSLASLRNAVYGLKDRDTVRSYQPVDYAHPAWGLTRFFGAEGTPLPGHLYQPSTT